MKEKQKREKNHELVGLTLNKRDKDNNSSFRIYTRFLCLAGTHDCSLNARLSIEAGFSDSYCLKTLTKGLAGWSD